jgi:hypothetical protein
VSVAPPGAKGTIIFIGLLGNGSSAKLVLQVAMDRKIKAQVKKLLQKKLTLLFICSLHLLDIYFN